MPDKTKAGTAVATKATDVDTAPDDELATFLKYMDQRTAAHSDLGARVLAATTVEDIFAAAGGTATKVDDILNVPVMLLSVEDYLPSDFSEGESTYGCFVVLSVAQQDGTKLTVTTGAATIMQQVYKLVAGEHLPHPVIFSKTEKATAAGYYPKFLRDATAEWEGGF